MRKTMGDVIQKGRIDKDLNLREAGEQIGMSHVLLGQIERGKASLTPRYWEKVSVVLEIPMKVIEELAGATAPEVRIDLANAPDGYRGVSLLLARRVAGQNLTKKDLKDLESILSK